MTARPEIKTKIDIPKADREIEKSEYSGLSDLEKKRKHNMGYIRIKAKENLPCPDVYELIVIFYCVFIIYIGQYIY